MPDDRRSAVADVLYVPATSNHHYLSPIAVSLIMDEYLHEFLFFLSSCCNLIGILVSLPLALLLEGLHPPERALAARVRWARGTPIRPFRRTHPRAVMGVVRRGSFETGRSAFIATQVNSSSKTPVKEESNQRRERADRTTHHHPCHAALADMQLRCAGVVQASTGARTQRPNLNWMLRAARAWVRWQLWCAGASRFQLRATSRS